MRQQFAPSRFARMPVADAIKCRQKRYACGHLALSASMASARA
jgi:hypothetical protein